MGEWECRILCYKEKRVKALPEMQRKGVSNKMALNNQLELALVSTTDMLEELSKRYPNMIFLGYKSRSKDIEEMVKRWQGHIVELLGIINIIEIEVVDAFNIQHTDKTNKDDNNFDEGWKGSVI